ncbi:HrpE/YscL family type III secretion apparatus protein [Rugamonas aquatica]|uniref:Type 3 secretion system stator protein n=1 Tax=Rugamonas aquatica TaxID=2743357 RepID=A0A6A7N766_9BURK|nr:HrpE/YscL family type III secretion apparatus protein [Rugamonas aquatica]MQA40728.1 HrpE/YscL family type III secretion apparatus protein [Rugamonas aquatica]
MVLFVRHTDKLAAPDPSAPLLPAAAHLQYVRAEALLAAAQAEATAVLAAAAAEREDERRRGYEEGVMQARAEAAEQMLSNVARTIDYFAGVEGRMTELVLQAMRRLVADYSDRERATIVVRGALAAVRSQKHVTLRVAAERLDVLRDALDGILAEFTGIGYVDLQADTRLRGDACVVETEIGVVEASLEAQIEALRRAFAHVFGKRC